MRRLAFMSTRPSEIVLVALHEIELLRSDSSGEEAESLERLRSFLCSALGWAELLVDLVQAKLSSMAIADREDRRERKFLQSCLGAKTGDPNCPRTS
jgi:hypothetical protein